MSGFAKLDSGIVDSSIWAENPETRVVWITLLAKCDKTGYARLSHSGLQRAANVSMKAVMFALERLSSPDSDSRTPTENGCRIKKIEGGWHVLNYEKYRNGLIEEAAREYLAGKKREERSKHLVETCRDTSRHVTDPSASASASGTLLSASEVPKGGAGGETMRLMRDNLNGLYDRDPKKQWTYTEESLLFQVVQENPDCIEELAELRNYERKTKYFPKSISSLLSDWGKHLDAAKSESRNVKKEQLVKPKTIQDKELDSIERSLKKYENDYS
jgi:hypothetical protein